MMHLNGAPRVYAFATHIKTPRKGETFQKRWRQNGFPVFPLAWDGLKGFKERGFLPEALMNYLALLGWNPGTNEELFEMDALVKIFDTEKIQKGGAKFDFEKARWINHKFLGFTDEKIIFERFPEFLECLPNTWSQKKRKDVYALLRDRLFLLEELKTQSKLFLEDPVDYDEKVMNKIQEHQPKKIIEQFCKMIKEDVDVQKWKSKIQEGMKIEGLPFGAIMERLRLAIMGNLIVQS